MLKRALRVWSSTRSSWMIHFVELSQVCAVMALTILGTIRQSESDDAPLACHPKTADPKVMLCNGHDVPRASSGGVNLVSLSAWEWKLCPPERTADRVR